MFRDCFRCGYGWHTKRFGEGRCPICTGMSDEQAEHVLGLRRDVIALRHIARKAYSLPAYTGLTSAEGQKIGFYL